MNSENNSGIPLMFIPFKPAPKAVWKLLPVIYIVILILPIYYNSNINSLNIFFGLFGEGRPVLDVKPLIGAINIHIGVIATLLMGGASIYIMRKRLHEFIARETFFVWFILFGMTVSVMTGMLIKPSVLNAVYYFQTILPILGYFVGRSILFRETHPNALVNTVVFSNTATIILFWLMMIFWITSIEYALAQKAVRHDNAPLIYEMIRLLGNNFGLISPQVRDYIFPTVFHQVKIYYPAVFMIAISFITMRIAKKGFTGWWALALIVNLSFLPLIWSRTGLVMFFAVIVGSVIVAVFQRWGFGFIKWTLTAAFAVGILGVFLTVKFSDSFVVVDRYSRPDLIDNSGDKRLKLILNAIEYSLRSPLIGQGFIPESGPREDGRKVQIQRLYGAHNQYLDYALRGGILALIGLIGIILKSLWDTWRRRAKGDRGFQIVNNACFFIVIAVTMGNMTQLYFIQAYPATLLWLLIGYISVDRTEQHYMQEGFDR